MLRRGTHDVSLLLGNRDGTSVPAVGVTELLTGDRDFARFAGLRVSDPFAGPPG